MFSDTIIGKHEYKGRPIGLWGEEREECSLDLGIVCIFVDSNGKTTEYPFPQHFMDTKEITVFIQSVIDEEYPEMLI